MLTLGIETSCDETAAAVISAGPRTLSNVILSQSEHSKFGGVVPEIASRSHVRAIGPIYLEALAQADIRADQLELIAATAGPGLVGPLLVGLTFAKGLAQALDKPFVGVNHLEGHIAANFLSEPDLPERHLTLIISGGHTLLVEVKHFGEYEVLGKTRDDAVGEAFDKVAKLLGLGYPGGQKIDELARKGNPAAIKFPRPMRHTDDFDFSYSGLKTAVALHWKALDESERESALADVAASFQEAAVDILVEKTLRAAQSKGIETVTLSGGVAANSRLRDLLDARLSALGLRFAYPDNKLCTDNAAMIAAAGLYQFQRSGASDLSLDADPQMRLA
jgi:N6-L-threonylcarbamoyladenine synthase